jgi:hypothetical protein
MKTYMFGNVDPRSPNVAIRTTPEKFDVTACVRRILTNVFFVENLEVLAFIINDKLT